ncbi:MAG: hypothetical protein HFE46_03405 [Clostridia bacterium]|nr:hypothetical protein [Clostridia bacterium]
MKKTLRFGIGILLVAALLCAAFSMAACDSDTGLLRLRVENARISFMRGDTFETGEEFAVYAEYKDGTEKNVTAEAAVRQESGMDMNVPGDYQITVSYGGKKVVYTVYVNDAEDVLRKIELDTSAVKKSYQLGDSVSFDGLVLKLTYENAQNALFTVTSTSLKNFSVQLQSADGTVTDEVFAALGAYTVTISQGDVKASYAVTVDGINISTVQGALAVGGFYRDRVASGETQVQNAMPAISDGTPYEAYRYTYMFGNNYTKFEEWHESPQKTFHCSKDDEGVFIVYMENGVIKTNNATHPDMINGVPFHLWYYKDSEYGIEAALDNLYAHAKACSNNDLKETADESTRAYSFAFSGLVFGSRDSDYYETQVKFTLGEDYNIESVQYTQTYYENNYALEGQMEGWVPMFTTDPATGITTPGKRFSQRVIVSVTQTAGERTAENEYDRDMFRIKSYDLVFNGQTLEDNATIECNVATPQYAVQIANIQPATAGFAQDTMYFDYEGSYLGGRKETLLSNEHFTVYRDDTTNSIRITVYHGGTWTLLFRTYNTERKLTISVTGNAPTQMTGHIYNSASKLFYASSSQTVAKGGNVYFYGKVNDFSDARQTAQLTDTDGDAETVMIGQTEIDGVRCFTFSATANGVYTVTVTSDAANSVSCVFTFTVNDLPVFDDLLNGAYTATDSMGNIYDLVFTFAGGAQGEGSVQVTKTPTHENGTPIEEQAVRETLSFTVDGGLIEVTPPQNDQLWVMFELNENNELMLVNARGNRYVLTRVEA